MYIIGACLGKDQFFRISVGGYHTCLSRREQGFESPIRNISPIVKWLSLLTLNQPSGVRISVGEWCKNETNTFSHVHALLSTLQVCFILWHLIFYLLLFYSLCYAFEYPASFDLFKVVVRYKQRACMASTIHKLTYVDIIIEGDLLQLFPPK